MPLLFLLLSLVARADDRQRFLDWAAEQPRVEPPPVAAGYRFSGDVFAQIATLVAEHPGVVDVEAIGTSHDGRPIWAFHIEDPATTPERDLLVFAGIHALEWISTEVATDVTLRLLDNPVPGVRVTVIPLLNPDGRDKVEQDLVAGANAYRRGNAKNVDLNRDFAVNREVRAFWAKLIPGYYAHSEVPLSQPESQAIDRLAAREVYDRAISLHAFGGFLYYPWTGRFARPPDHEDFVALGRIMEQAQADHAYKTRQLSRWGFFFRAQGSEIDHLYGKYGTRAFLIEVTRSGLHPLRPKTWSVYFRMYNPVRPERHRERAARAVHALVRTPPTPGEIERPAGKPRTDEIDPTPHVPPPRVVD